MIIKKNKFLNILLVSSFSLSVVNANAFSLTGLLENSKNSFGDFIRFVKQEPGSAAFTIGYFAVISALIATVAVVLIKDHIEYNKKVALCNKKIAETCILCEKANEDCQCDLFQKINYVFSRYGVTETIRYYNGSYCGRDSDWLIKKIKSVILKINDVNVKFVLKDKDYSLTLLHIACYYGYEPIVKWLVEDMFVDINVVDSNGISPSQMLKDTVSRYRCMGTVVGEELDSSKAAFLGSVDELLLEKKEELQRKLLDCVKSLKDIFVEYKKYDNIDSLIKSKIKNIKNFVSNKETPGFAKQLVMPDLVFIHENSPKFISDSLIVDLYKKIAFNYTFLNDARFTKAVEFAKNKDIKDIYGRSVDQASGIYKEENKGIKCENCTDFFETDATTTISRKYVQYIYI